MKRRISPKKSLRIGYVVVLANGLTLWAIYAFSMLSFDSNVSAIHRRAEATKKVSDTMAHCVADIKNRAEEYLRLRTPESRADFMAKTDGCVGELTKEDAMPLGGEVAAEKARIADLIRKFSITTLEIGTRVETTDKSIRSALQSLEGYSSEIRSLKGNGEVANHISALILALSSYLVARTKIDTRALHPHQQAVQTLLKKDHRVSRALKTAIDDSLVDLTAVASIWNRTIEQMESSYTPQGVALIKAIATFSGRHIEDIGAESQKTRNRLQIVGILSLVSLFIFFAIIRSMFGWLNRAYSSVLQRLESVSLRVLEGDEAVIKELAENQRRSEKLDEIGVAYKAIAETLSRLGAAKKSLEQKIEELSAAQEQIIQSGKLAGLGTMAAGIAHELNNPLGICFSSAEALQDPTLPPDLRAKMLENIKSQTMRATKIISQMKRLARKSGPENADTAVALKTLIDNSMVLVEDRIRNQSVKISRGDEGGMELLCDPVKFESVISNILQNALDAFNEPATKDKPGKELRIGCRRNDKGALAINITDNGPGMPEEVKKKIFEPFFTTKEVGKGTGLGLSICFQIVHEMGGTVGCSSKVGEGTTFTITLPKERVVGDTATMASPAAA